MTHYLSHDIGVHVSIHMAVQVLVVIRSFKIVYLSLLLKK